MTVKPPSPTFEIQLRGPGVVPEDVPLHYLSDVLAAVQRLASGRDPDDDVGDEDAEDVDDSIGLLKVKRGSAIFQCVAKNPRIALKNLSGAGRFINDPAVDEEDRFAFALKPIHTLSAIANSLDCDILIRDLDHKQRFLVAVDSDSFKRVSRSVLVSGETTLIGRVQRVGGATRMRCALRVQEMHRLLYCDVATQEVSRQLGSKIYQEVEATGVAKWLQRSWRLYDFRIESIKNAPERKPLRQGLEALREAGGKVWERIENPQEVLEGMR
jgi:Fe-S cluster biosynthesis and repair protein YggX